MAGTGDKLGSLRPGRFEGGRVMLALAISLLVHTLVWAGYELNRDFHWMSRAPLSRMKPAQIQRYEQPLQFVMVETPSTQAPKVSKYISNKNSQAADQSKSRNSDNPKLNGRQTDAPKTEDEIRAQIAAAQAAAAELRQLRQSSESRPAQSEGDLT
ncbi:MAG: hypothetical protein ACRED1_09605, partial [Limisphaerales bacterium]